MDKPAIPERRLILASASPRRRELLRQLGLEFTVAPADFDEEGVSAASPDRLVRSLAHGKASAVAASHPNEVVLGADTVVVLDEEVLGKPGSKEEAMEMLSRLRGRTHRVYTGIALVCAKSNQEEVAHEATEVTMGAFAQETLARYVASGEPMDKAGAYGIQGLGSILVERISGCYFNVVGLPLYRLGQMLASFGIRVP